MGYFYKTTEEQRREIIRRYQCGETPTQIAPDYNVTRSYISVLAKKAGCNMQGSGNTPTTRIRIPVPKKRRKRIIGG